MSTHTHTFLTPAPGGGKLHALIALLLEKDTPAYDGHESDWTQVAFWRL